MPCTGGTCRFHERVHNGGHYKKSLEQACEEAKKKKRVCEAGTTTVSKTTGLKGCSLPSCDKKAGIKRDGPGNRQDGGFDESQVDWDDCY